MAKSLETNYSQQEFLNLTDELDGMAVTLEDSVGSYIESLGDYINGDLSDYRLEDEINSVVLTLELVYDTLESFDQMVEDENMVARAEKNGDRGKCDLEENLANISEGIYCEIESFNDVLTLIHYIEKADIEADPDYLRTSRDAGAPTQLMADRDRLIDISQRLDREYNRIVFGEILARRHTESEDSLEIFEPEPPIFRMIGHEDHAKRVNHLNKAFNKNR